MKISRRAAQEASIAAKFTACLRNVLGKPSHPIPLHEPQFKGNEWSYVKECLDTGWVSSVGKYVDEFEARLAEYVGSRYAIVVVNGTAALQMALMVAGVKPGDEVLVPALSFVATANAVVHCGAVPHFVDSAESTLGLDPSALQGYLSIVTESSERGLLNRRTGRRLAAVVPMHTFGHPVDMPALLSVAKGYNLRVVEDAAESLGSFIGSKHTGTFGDMGVLSFNGNKVITTGGGGAILTDVAADARRLKHLTTTAKQAHPWEFVHDEVAYNFRLPNINAALGCAQLERLPTLLGQKRKLAGSYQAVFGREPAFSFIGEPAGCRSNYWLNTIRLQNGSTILRNSLLQSAHDAGYLCRPVWRLLSRLPMYEACPRAPLPVAEQLERELINLPSGPGLVKD